MPLSRVNWYKKREASSWVVLLFCVASILLALIVGRDPAVRAYQQARARGEEVTPERVPAISE